VLIKTSIEFLEVAHEKNDVLLGLWCLKNSNNLLDNKNNFKIIPYHWDDREKYSGDYVYLESLYERLLLQLARELNEIHGLNESLMYWRIIIGPWLWFFIDVIFDRYECIKQARESYPEVTAKFFSYNLDDWCPLNFSEFWFDITSEEWNEVIFSECIKVHEIIFEIRRERIEPSRNQLSKPINYKEILTYLNKLYSKFVRTTQTGSILLEAYIPTSKLIRLQLKLGQVPYLKIPKLKLLPSKNKSLMRENICQEFICLNGFEIFLTGLIPSLIPKNYLEDFLQTKAKVMNSLPSNPRAIFTANAYHGNDNFKIWAAEKVSLNIPLIIGQHGGSFGTALINQSEQHQLKIADKFLSWGWEIQGGENVIKFPSLQLSGRASIKGDPNGKILHVLSSLPRYFYQHFSMPVAGQFLSYLENQILFLNELEDNVSKHIIVRPDKSGVNTGWNIAQVLDVAGHSFRIDKSKDSFLKSLKKSRLCICTHNATVFLECLSMNFPTIIFWEPSHHEIRSDAVPYFDLLLEAGILFYTPEEAAKKVNTVVHNVDEWWFSDQVQSARKKFCERYAATSSDWEREWGEFLLGVKKIS
jgi:putative transferase (TIGR04331 family)